MTDPERPSLETYALTEIERQLIFDHLVAPAELQRVQAVAHPRVIYVGGQPGAGKSSLQDRLRSRLEEAEGPDTVLEINNDRFRAYHPRYRELQQLDDQRASHVTNPDANAWVDMAIEASRALGAHVLLESSLRRTDDIVATTQEYANSGFGAELHVAVTHPLFSRLAVAERYLGQVIIGEPGRYVLAETQAEASEQLPRSLRALCASGVFQLVAFHPRQGTRKVTEIASPASSVDAVATAYQAELLRQSSQLDQSDLQRRADLCIALATQHGKHECHRDMLAYQGDLASHGR